MSKIWYKDHRFNRATREILTLVDAIIKEYAAQGFDLTLRQLYYQLVARDYIPNSRKEYNKLGRIVNHGRLAGMLDWNTIVDRIRRLESRGHWTSPGSILRSAASSYNTDKWADQDVRPEVWIEKDALTSVISGVCRKWDVSYIACRGYISQSAMWRAAMRHKGPQRGYIIHLADHDPSGIDMTRDIDDRFCLFDALYDVNRIALNMDQVEHYNPPPNPAKLLDSRSDDYIAQYGRQSWELDALEPAVIVGLIENEIASVVDIDMWNEAVEKEEHEREILTKIADNYRVVSGYPQDLEDQDRRWDEE